MFATRARTTSQLSRRLAIFIATLLLCVSATHAATGTYTFSQSSAVTFAPLTGSTVLQQSMGDDTISTPIPIGFTFYYDGTRYTHINVGMNGYASLNTLHTAALFDNTNALSTIVTNNVRPFLAPLWDDHEGGGDTQVSYKLEGTVGTRIFTVQWLNHYWAFGATAPVISFQIKLYEVDGAVEFWYRPEAGAISNTEGGASVGIASLATGAGNYLSVTNLSGAGTASSAVDTSSVGAKPTTDLMLRFAPPVMSDGATALLAVVPAAPTGGTQVNLSWTNPTDTDHKATVVYQSDDAGATWITRAVVTAPTNTFNATLLGWNTAHQFRVQAISDGCPSAISNTASASTLTGTSPTAFVVGGTSAVDSLSGVGGVFAQLAANGLAGDTLIELSGTYVSTSEVIPMILPAFAGRGAKLTIRPAAGAIGRVITGASSVNSVVVLNGGRFVTIEGRPGGVGGMSLADNLTIQNTNTTASNFSGALSLNGDGSDIVVQYCNLQASNPGTTATAGGGVVFLNPGGATSINGLDRATIDHCNVGPAGVTLPGNGIVTSSPSVTVANSLDCYMDDCVISNNNIFDFYFSTSSGNTQCGVKEFVGINRCTIEGNFIFQTASRANVTGITSDYRGISMSTFGGGHITRNNTIGPNQFAAGGWTITGAFPGRFQGIVAVGGMPKNRVYNNTVRDINLTTSSGGSATFGVMNGITVIGTGGDLDLGVDGANVIGSQIATGSLVVSGSTSAADVYNAGINVLAFGGIDVQNNIIGGLTASGTGPTTQTHVIGIYERTTGTLSGTSAFMNFSRNYSNNTIGGTVANSLFCGNAAVSTTATSGVWGIRLEPTTGGGGSGTANTSGVFTIAGNTIRNLANTKLNDVNVSTGTARGISAGISGSTASIPVASITGNTISNITYGLNNAGVDNLAALSGISNMSVRPGQVISANTISGLTHTPPVAGAALASRVQGVHLGTTAASTGNTVSRNLVFGLNNGTTNTGSQVVGINNTAAAAATFENNMVRLGLDASGAAITAGTLQLLGLRDASTVNTNTWNHNTSVVTGGPVAAGSVFTAAMIRAQNVTAGSLSVRNNIFENSRTNGAGTGGHFGIVVNTVANVNSDFNLFNHVTGSGQAVGGINATTPVASVSLANWQADTTTAGTPQDAGARFGNPGFVAGAAATADLHIATAATALSESLVAPSGLATVDFDGQTRASFSPANVDLGADGGVFDIVSPSVSSIAAQTSQSIDLTFSEGMHAPSVPTPASYTLSNVGQGTLAANPTTVTPVIGNTYQLAWVAGSMVNGADITVTVGAGPTDNAGNPVGSPNSATQVGGGLPVELSGFGIE